MPDQYTAIRDSYIKRGKSMKTAKKMAAMTYIARGKGGTRSSRAKSLHHESAAKAIAKGYKKKK